MTPAISKGSDHSSHVDNALAHVAARGFTSEMRKYLSRLFLFCYRASIRLRSKCSSLLMSGAFASFGPKTVIMLPIRLSGENRIALGDGVYIGAGSWLQTLPDNQNQSVAIFIGTGTSIAGSCVISAVRNVYLEEDVLLARNVYIADHSHRYTRMAAPIIAQGLDRVAAVRIRRGAWLGQNVVVCPGVTIGIGAVVGANSVVNRDVPDYCIAAGAPARVIRAIHQERSVEHAITDGSESTLTTAGT
jgi:carbonic anhydrase/acetyltransferase-like protein (isoleucine patch superfamily)